MSIRNILDDLDINYTITGDEAKARCPVHKDVHPSWYCNLDTGVHHCFACDFKGTIITLVQYRLNCSVAEAISYCYTRTGLAKAEQWLKPKVERPEIEVDESHLALFTDPPEHALTDKRITLEAAQYFGVLWNPVTSGWIFPVRNPHTNKLIGWQEKIGGHFRNYPRGIKKSETLFGLSAFEHGSTAVLVESPIDTVRLLTCGIRGGLSSYGVSTGDKQFALIHEFAGHLILAFDNDLPGVRETARVCRDVKTTSISVFDYGLKKHGLRYDLAVVKGIGKDIGELSDDAVRRGYTGAINRVVLKLPPEAGKRRTKKSRSHLSK